MTKEYVAFQGEGLSLAGAHVTNPVVLQSTGKMYGGVGTRAGVLWTRNARIRASVARHIPSWPLSLLDVTFAVAALHDTAWLHEMQERYRESGQALEQLLVQHFGDAVVPSGIHYRFVHLDHPQRTHEHLLDWGINTRLLTGTGPVARGLRVMAPREPVELGSLQAALQTLPQGTAL